MYIHLSHASKRIRNLATSRWLTGCTQGSRRRLLSTSAQVHKNCEPGSMSEILDEYDTVVLSDALFDFENQSVLQRCLNYIDQSGKAYRFFCNTDTQSRAEVAALAQQKFQMQFQVDQVYTSASLAARYLKEYHEEVKKVHVVGMDALCDELSQLGIAVSGGPSVDQHLGKMPINIDKFNEYPMDSDIGAVLVGQDNDFNYTKLCLASLYIQACQGKPRLPFLCTNEVPNHVIDCSRVYPGAGAIVEAIQISLNNEQGDQESKRPTVIGKPSAYGLKAIKNDCKSDRIALLSTGYADDDISMTMDADTRLFQLDEQF